MITVANCFDMVEVQSLRIALDSHGIGSFVPDETVATIAPYLFASKSGVRLQVTEEDAERAAEIIAEARRSRADDAPEIP